MSVKIYEGMLLKNSTVAGIDELVQKCKIELTPMLNKEFRQYVTMVASDLYIRMNMGAITMPDVIDQEELAKDYFREPTDPNWKDNPLTNKTILNIAKSIVMAACMDNVTISYLKEKFLIDHFDLEIEFIPIEDKVICIPHAGNQDILDIIANDPLMKEYNYSRSSGAPEGITSSEWKERESVWEKAYEKRSDPGTPSGFTVSIVNANRDIDTDLNSVEEDILPYLPSNIEQMIRESAYYTIYEKYYKENREFEDEMDINDQEIWDIVADHGDEINKLIEDFKSKNNLEDFLRTAK